MSISNLNPAIYWRRVLRRFPLKRPGLIASLVMLFVVSISVIAVAELPSDAPALRTLPAIDAIGSRVDTLFVGGYAHGSFTQAMEVLASDLSTAERKLVGQHLDKIFGGLVEGGLRESGRLRLTYERTVLPSGETGAIRVLAAEAAVGGEMYTAFYFEQNGEPGYFDLFGKELDGDSWIGPLARNRVTSPFGMDRMHPLLRRVLPHTGVDYAAAVGTPVRATGDGVVAVATWRGGYGRMIEIRHPNGYTTRYAHLSRIADEIEKGAAVRQSDVIGFSGQSGRVTGPHLHYEVRRSGRPIDPTRALRTAALTWNVSVDPQWPQQRRDLSRLLSQVPTMVSQY